MKRIFALFLAVLLLAGCTAQPAETQPQTTEPEAGNTPFFDGKTLKILAIGNSFSNNTTQYLYDVAAAEGVTNIILGRLYIGGCSLSKHVNNAKSNAPAYDYYKNTAGYWEKTEAASLLYGLTDEDWDIITMQQNSGNSGQPDSYDVLPQLIEYVNQNKTNPSARLVWHMTWAYQGDSDHTDFLVYAKSQDVMYQQIVAATQQKILTNDAFSGFIAAGTAIQNARSSYFGDNLTADGYHLNDLGKIVATYTWYATLLGKPLEKVSLDQIPGSIPLTDSNKAVIIESVNNALAKPLEVTPSQITEAN